MSSTYIFRSASAGIFMLFVCWHHAQAQNNSSNNKKTEDPSIAWVSQYPASKGNKKQNTVTRVYEFLVKKNKQRTLVRPVAILPKSPADFCVLDQGGQTIFNIEEKKTEILRCIKKKENYFTSLVGVCALPGGEILFSDSRLNKVFLIGADKKKLAPLNDTIQFQQPTGVAYSAATDEIWVVETGAHRIAVLSRQGALVKTIGTRGNENGQFNYPTSIWIDRSGDAFVVDAMNFRVEIFNKDGAFVSSFGEAGDATGSLARPKGIATDTYGNIYVVDALFNVVQVFDRAGNLLYNFGKQGREKGEFWMPSGIFIDEKNYIYIADNYNSRVQIFQLINGG